MSSRALVARQAVGLANEARFIPRFGASPIEPEPEAEPEGDPLEDAFAQGVAEGQARAQAEYAARLAEIEARFSGLDRSFSELAGAEQDRLRARLTEVVAALCEATLRPLALDREALARRVDRAAGMLQRAADERRVRLHPDDLELVRPLVSHGLSLEADPSLARGALRIDTKDGGIEDGPDCWAAAIREALGQC